MNPYLLPSIDAGPKIISMLLKRIPASSWDTALDADRFTLREVIAHLADWEPIMRARIVQAVDQPGSKIQLYDEAQMAIDHTYASTNPLQQADLFSSERAKTCEYMKRLTMEEFSRTANHPERGELSAEDLANLLLGHDLYHIEQVASYLP